MLGLIIGGIILGGLVYCFWDVVKEWALEILDILGASEVLVTIFRIGYSFYLAAYNAKNRYRRTTEEIEEKNIDPDVLATLKKMNNRQEHQLGVYR